MIRSTKLDGVNIMSGQETTGASDSARTMEDTTIPFSTIDNLNYAYLLSVADFNGASTHRLFGVTIEYTVEEPLP